MSFEQLFKNGCEATLSMGEVTIDEGFKNFLLSASQTPPTFNVELEWGLKAPRKLRSKRKRVVKKWEKKYQVKKKVLENCTITEVNPV